MSRYYADDNKETAKKLFRKRIIYLRVANTPGGSRNIVNFNLAEKILYGRVDKRKVPIHLVGNNPIAYLKSFGGNENFRAMNFVVDAFNKLAQQFEKCAMTGKIRRDDPFLSNIKIFKAFEDPMAKYNEHINVYNGTLLSMFRSNNIVFSDFDEFVGQLLPILKATTKRTPYTLPAYMKSSFCPITCSGLSIEIADLDASNDTAKIKRFVNSKNWEFYVNTCNSYGFMIDQFVPWRLVADIGSPDLIEQYAAKYELHSTDAVIDLGYTRSHITYYERFKYFMLNLYSMLKVPDYAVLEACGDHTVNKIVVPTTYSIETLTREYDEAYFLNLYFTLRFYEEESKFTDIEKERIIRDCIGLYRATTLARSLYDFEIILNKTFDYSGSMGYYSRGAKAKKRPEGS